MVWNRRHRWRGRRPETVAAVAGAAAFLLGIALVYTTSVRGIERHMVGLLPYGVTVGSQVATGWLFYNAHFVDVIVTYGSFVSNTEPTNFVAAGDYSGILYVIPPFVLLAAGVVTVRSIRIEDCRDAALAGALTAIGYLPLAIVGALLATVSTSAQGPGRHLDAVPDVTFAVLLAGLAYPVVFGGLGGVLGTVAGTVDPRRLREPSE